MKKLFLLSVLFLIVVQSVVGYESVVINTNNQMYENSSNEALIEAQLPPEITWEQLEGKVYKIIAETPDYIFVEVDGTLYVVVK